MERKTKLEKIESEEERIITLGGLRSNDFYPYRFLFTINFIKLTDSFDYKFRYASQLRTMLIIVFLLTFPYFIYFVRGQDVANKIVLSGMVFKHENNKKLYGTLVEIIHNGKVEVTTTTQLSGSYKLFMDYGKNYIIRYTKDGYVTKKLSINVATLEKIPNKDFEMLVDVTLFESYEGVDVSPLNKPMGIANFEKGKKKIKWDDEYSSKMNEVADRIIKEIKKRKEEAERLVKMLEKERLAELKRQEELVKMEEEYNRLIVEADNFFSNDQFIEAKSSYSRAIRVKQEQYPKDQIEKISDLLAQLDQKEEEYSNFLELANNAFSQESYHDARVNYQNALNVKPNEVYPKEKIEAIEQALTEIAKKEEKYQKAIQQADQAFGNQEYAQAKEAYSSASRIKPHESYPREKMNEIDELLGAMEVSEQEYLALITKGEQNFSGENYQEALKNFQAALSIKSEETYPSQKIDEINVRLLEIEQQEQQYQTYISTADNLHQSEAYEGAVENYQNALGIKPNEAYPSDKIKEIQDLLNQQVEEKIVEQVEETKSANFAEEVDYIPPTNNRKTKESKVFEGRISGPLVAPTNSEVTYEKDSNSNAIIIEKTRKGKPRKVKYRKRKRKLRSKRYKTRPEI